MNKSMNRLYSFTANCIVFYTNVSLNERFTRYLEYHNPDLEKKNVVVTFGEMDITSYEPGIVTREPDVVSCKQDAFPCEKKPALPTNFFENAPLEQWWGSPDESNFAWTVQDTRNVDKSSEPIIYSSIRSHSQVRMPFRKSRRKRKKRKAMLPLTKEALDDELDRYMISLKHL